MKLSRKFWHDLLLRWPLEPLRHRLRCPRCNKVGTWKPRGPVIREDSEAATGCGGYYKLRLRYPGLMREAKRRRWVGYVPRRWLCKWCGLYDGQGESEVQAVISPHRGCWSLERLIEADEESWTPLDDWEFGSPAADPWGG